ncbi:histidine-rich carboxyl terminus protein 1 [Clarias gariepinus]|uniref:histidine-rich carboxyl terminus protein 1 n=1 Tax=Clarias gariepinus TaxID=13013 RepID=UPI00234DB330|nr:histidine-rich carboxyl terminus protein 1 [Clarias gariepinus]
MKLTIVFGLLVILAACAAMSDFPVACYVDASTQHMIFLVDPFLCTYVIYSAAYIGDDLSFKTLSLDVDPFNSMLKKLKDRNPALRVLLGVGVKRSRLEVLSQQQITLDNFITLMLKYVMENNYDGVEFTWLENEIDETLRSTEPLTSFIKELRGQAVNKPLLVFVSLLDHSNHMSTHIDQKTLSQYTDFICLLPLNYNNEGPQISNTVSYWQDLADPKKLMMAVPKIVQQQNSSKAKSTAIKPERKVEQIDNPGLIIAKQVCKDIKSGQMELKGLTQLERCQSHLKNESWLLQKGFGGVGVIMLDIDNFFNSVCLNCTKNETAILEDVITGHRHGHSHHRHHHHRHHHWHNHQSHHRSRHHDHRHHRHGHRGHRHRRHHKHGHHHTHYHHEDECHSHSHHRNHHHG